MRTTTVLQQQIISQPSSWRLWRQRTALNPTMEEVHTAPIIQLLRDCNIFISYLTRCVAAGTTSSEFYWIRATLDWQLAGVVSLVAGSTTQGRLGLTFARVARRDGFCDSLRFRFEVVDARSTQTQTDRIGRRAREARRRSTSTRGRPRFRRRSQTAGTGGHDDVAVTV